MAVLVSLLVGTSACDDGTEPSGPPTLHDRIVLVSNRSGGPSLYQMRLDGSAITPIPQDGLERPFGPRVSPDGSWIAFQGQFGDIWIQEVDGTGPRNLTGGAAEFCTLPAWAPGGGRLAFSCAEVSPDDYDIWVVNSDGSGLAPVTDGPGLDFDPTWSPDGNQIVFSSNREGNDELYSLDLDSGNLTNLTETTDSDEFFPRFSPDGTSIAYVSDPVELGEPFALELMEVATGEVKRLSGDFGNAPRVDWSPDSRFLVFARRASLPEVGDIVRLNVESGDIKVLVPPDGFVDESPAYGPRRFGL